ncbi:MAG: alpha/beta hydrolase [Mycobacteriales bacterium]|nr:MAG: alpha/beta hydrolase [Pseudonocardiales bacterium]
MPAEPRLFTLAPRTPARAVAVVLHGGRATSDATVPPWSLAALRLLPFAKALHTAGRDHGLVVARLRYRVRGWNGAAADPVADVTWALRHLDGGHPGLPAALVGHSMGGRAALGAAGQPRVQSIAALAPWITETETVEQLRGRRLLIAHGDRDRTTDPRLSRKYAERARAVTDVCRFEVHGDGHAMLWRAAAWHDLVCRFVLGTLDLEPLDQTITNAMQSPDGLDVPLPRRP